MERSKLDGQHCDYEGLPEHRNVQYKTWSHQAIKTYEFKHIEVKLFIFKWLANKRFDQYVNN